jgi:hypothetical protein
MICPLGLTLFLGFVRALIGRMVRVPSNWISTLIQLYAFLHSESGAPFRISGLLSFEPLIRYPNHYLEIGRYQEWT